MNTNKKAIMALVMVLVMLAVPLTAMQQSEESDAGTVAPTPSHYAYKVTYSTTSGVTQSQITGVYKDGSQTAEETVTLVGKGLKTVAEINALAEKSSGDVYMVSDAGTITSGSLTVAAGDSIKYDGTSWVKYTIPTTWSWSSTTGLGPFNMFYAAISVGVADDNALSDKAGHIAYILDPADLTKAVKYNTSSSYTMTNYNIMLVIPTVYWYSDTNKGILYISDTPNNSNLPDDVKSNMKAYAHQVDNGTVYPYLAIGVYEAKYDSTYGLMSQTGGNPTASTNLATFRSYADKANDLIEDDCGTYTLWNFYEWTLYKILAQTVIGNKNAQSVIGYGIAAGSGSGTIGATNAGGPYVGMGGTTRSDSKLFIENAWGSVWEFVDNTYITSYKLKAGSGLHPTLAYAETYSHSGDIDGYDYTGGNVSIPEGKGNNVITSTYTASAYWDVPSDASGTGTSGYATGDNMWSAANDRCLIVGGHWNCGASDGLSAWSSNYGLSLSLSNIGARLAYMMTADAAGMTTYELTFSETGRTTHVNVTPASTIMLPTAADVEGKAFDGWYSDKDCTQEFIGPAGAYFKPVGTATLYAKYSDTALTSTIVAVTAIDNSSADAKVTVVVIPGSGQALTASSLSISGTCYTQEGGVTVFSLLSESTTVTAGQKAFSCTFTVTGQDVYSVKAVYNAVTPVSSLLVLQESS